MERIMNIKRYIVFYKVKGVEEEIEVDTFDKEHAEQKIRGALEALHPGTYGVWDIIRVQPKVIV